MLEDPYHDPDPDENKNEWSAKRTIVRILMYSISLTLICVSFIIVFQNFEFQKLKFAVPTILLSSTYIYYDLRILFGRKK